MHLIKHLPQTDLIVQAYQFASKAHGEINQTREVTGEPYIVHPVEVATLLHEVGEDEFSVAAGLLHDVGEDTHYTQYEIKQRFGAIVAEMVFDVTNVHKVAGNRATRKAIDRARLAAAQPRSKTLKAADICSNCRTLLQLPHSFLTVYIPELHAMLAVLDGANPDLHAQAVDQVQNAAQSIGISL